MQAGGARGWLTRAGGGLALALVVDELRKDAKVSVEVFDPARIPLPLPGTGINSPEARALQDAVQRATAIVLCALASGLAAQSVYPTGTTIYDPDRSWNGFTVLSPNWHSTSSHASLSAR